MREEIFMAYDIRGREISTHDAFILGKSLGNYYEGTCFIGWDCRKKSPELAEHLIEGLRSSGIKVTIGGFMPGPACYYKTFNNYDFGVYITASHLPPEYSGFKIIMNDGSSIDPNDLLKIKELFHNKKFSKQENIPVIQDITSINDYARFLKNEFGRNEIKCVIDCMNASTGAVTNNIFKQLLNAKVINQEPLPDFGGKEPEPSEKTLKQAQEEVIKEKAAFGVGLDGDGDRSLFIDETGRIINGNLMTMLFSKHILSKNKGVIVAPVSVSSMLETKIVKPAGGSVKWCLVGHTFIEKELVKSKGLFGGEESSHFYPNQYYPFSDGIIITLMLARILKETGKKLSELVTELPELHVSKEEIEFATHHEKEAKAKKLINQLVKEHPKANTLDGIKFEEDNAFILVRPSQTRHTIKVFVEAETRKQMEEKLEKYTRIIESYK